jgi:hypothetical protein
MKQSDSGLHVITEQEEQTDPITNIHAHRHGVPLPRPVPLGTILALSVSSSMGAWAMTRRSRAPETCCGLRATNDRTLMLVAILVDQASADDLLGLFFSGH